jgi:pimeloyl-ACP methyl ester carboxylesterase
LLCGLNYGPWIAASFALRYPEKVEGLVLCGGCTGISEADPDEREAFRVSRSIPLNAGQTPADFAPAVVDIIAGPQATDTVRAALTESMAAIQAETYRHALNCFCNPLEKRERILQAALREFPKNGNLGASMQTITDRAEVSKLTFYQYVGQKGDMFRAVLDQGRAGAIHVERFACLFRRPRNRHWLAR